MVDYRIWRKGSQDEERLGNRMVVIGQAMTLAGKFVWELMSTRFGHRIGQRLRERLTEWSVRGLLVTKFTQCR
jgi:hypothetical protein